MSILRAFPSRNRMHREYEINKFFHAWLVLCHCDYNKRRGISQSDVASLTDEAAWMDIESVAGGHPDVFFQIFAWSMVRLGMVDVKVDSQG
jgi:hypothetical protein